MPHGERLRFIPVPCGIMRNLYRGQPEATYVLYIASMFQMLKLVFFLNQNEIQVQAFFETHLLFLHRK